VHPVEVWDLLALLGIPPDWSASAFIDFFDILGRGNPSHEEFERIARLFRSSERWFGSTTEDGVFRAMPNGGRLAAKKILRALHDEAQTERRQLDAERRRAALAVMRANTPVARLISRHTRELLRRYQAAGKLSARIA